jgi:hypothetical protein
VLVASSGSSSNIFGESIDQQRKGPGVPKQIENIDRLFQRPLHQHAEFFHKMRLWIKRCQPEKQRQGDEKPVAEQTFHADDSNCRRR